MGIDRRPVRELLTALPHGLLAGVAGAVVGLVALPAAYTATLHLLPAADTLSPVSATAPLAAGGPASPGERHPVLVEIDPPAPSGSARVPRPGADPKAPQARGVAGRPPEPPEPGEPSVEPPVEPPAASVVVPSERAGGRQAEPSRSPSAPKRSPGERGERGEDARSGDRPDDDRESPEVDDHDDHDD